MYFIMILIFFPSAIFKPFVLTQARAQAGQQTSELAPSVSFHQYGK